MATNQTPIAATLWTTEQLAEIIGVARGTLEQWRVKGWGPPWVKFADDPKSPVRYRPEDVEAWKESLPRFGPTVPQKVA